MPFGLSPAAALAAITTTVMALLVLFEWRTGKYSQGRKTASDWKMLGLSAAGIALVERPVMLACIYFAAERLAPETPRALAWIEDQHFVLGVIGFIAIDELLHGFGHFLTHQPPPKNRLLALVHAFYREAHRAHHVLGDGDGRGQVSVTQSLVAGWGWFLFLPNYWFVMATLALGMADTWLCGMLIKNCWGMHVHTNWSYDLYLLNHPNRWVRRGMTALCHVFTFPNQHHQHHSRTRNSARNMQNVLAIYDWLLWKTLVIEREHPTVYGWKQQPHDERTLVRYLRRPLRVSKRTRRAAEPRKRWIAKEASS